MHDTATSLIRLEEIPNLPQESVVNWHHTNLNPALLALQQMGGYDAFRVKRASGPYIYTTDGKRLLDIVSTYGALNHGHNHLRLLKAARWFDDQETTDLLKEFPSPYAAALAHNLSEVTGADLERMFFCNSGSEAVEGALKLAMRFFQGERTRFVYTENCLHGKTLGTLSVNGREKLRKHIRGFEDWPMVTYGDIEGMEAVFSEDREKRIAAVILEPIQGEAGVIVPPEGYLKAVRRLCDRHGALLILDEIQTGFGRTGSLFRFQKEEVVPDILCLAKSLGGGMVSIGATMARKEIYEKSYGRFGDSLIHTSTFGGRSRATALALEALAVAIDDDFAGNAEEVGTWLRDELEKVKDKHPDIIRDIRGSGLMIGLEFQPAQLSGLAGPIGSAGANKLVDHFFPGFIGAALLERHNTLSTFVLNHPRVMRIYPPLVATKEDLVVLPESFDEVLSGNMNRLVTERLARGVQRIGLRGFARWLSNW